jgi:hypothetical protein
MTQSVSTDMMHFIPFHINRAKRSGGAEVLAGTTADAFVFVHRRHFDGTVRSFIIHHLDGTRRAMALTIATTDAIGQNDAVFFYPYGMADMYGGL